MTLAASYPCFFHFGGCLSGVCTPVVPSGWLRNYQPFEGDRQTAGRPRIFLGRPRVLLGRPRVLPGGPRADRGCLLGGPRIFPGGPRGRPRVLLGGPRRLVISTAVARNLRFFFLVVFFIFCMPVVPSGWLRNYQPFEGDRQTAGGPRVLLGGPRRDSLFPLLLLGICIFFSRSFFLDIF